MRHAEWKEPRRLCMLFVFFFGHWLASVFFQSLFQHRYAAHRMYTMKPRTERGLHLLTYLVDRKSTRLNSSHLGISYAVFCLKKKNIRISRTNTIKSNPR